VPCSNKLTNKIVPINATGGAKGRVGGRAENQQREEEEGGESDLLSFQH
jgi:hypothetical protein